MKNWIIFKGKNSNSINGLMICELPQISKPAMRVETTLIDGKDGEIIEKLGYLSYDKIIKIGLYKNFNIDEIIKYFSSDGEVVFSNEPDKIYISNIFEQINYEKLLKFKTANIKFHVQPHKYLLDENPVNIIITTQNSVNVQNAGLEISKPIITLFGTGIVQIFINNIAIFQIDIDDEFVAIDSEKEEAHKENILKNRLMIGEFPSFDVGLNTISWTGNLTKIIVEPKSRWI